VALRRAGSPLLRLEAFPMAGGIPGSRSAAISSTYNYRPLAAIVAEVALLSSVEGRRFNPIPVNPLRMEKTGEKRLKKQNGR